MIRLRLNDHAVELPDAAAETPLVYALRDPCVGDMTPKVGCGQEHCGACRVLVDGVPAYSCTVPSGAVGDRHVETAAGLDTPVRRALVEANATQCGFCLPGIVVAAEALFRENPSPEPAAIAQALDPQLCRCGSHPRVVRALVALAGRRPVEPPAAWSAAGQGARGARPDDRPLPPALVATPSLARWIRFPEPGRVLALTGKVDVGQGLLTALAVIVAEELDVGFERVSVLSGHTGHTPDEGVTASSLSIETSGAALRQASAWARKLLLERASERLGAPATDLAVRDGEITGPGVNERLDYWDLANEGLDAEIDHSVSEKPAQSHTLVGREGHRRADVAPKATAAAFVHDVPADLHARPVRPPSLHHRLTGLEVEVDAPGVLIVDGSFVAIAHPDEYEAVRLAERVAGAARWRSAGEAPWTPRIEASRRRAAEALPLRDGVPTRAEWRPTPTPHRARYTRPFLMHGSLGPSAAMARWTAERLYVECASRGVEPLRQVLARVFGMDAADVELRHVPGPGGYGHNGADDVALDAALVARAVPGRTVSMKWSREDEHAFEPLGPPMHMELGADLDADGRIATWTHDVYGYTHVTRVHPQAPGVDLLAARWLAEPFAPTRPRPALTPEVGIHRNALPIYRFADTQVTKHFLPDAPVRTSALRGLGAQGNVFAIESFMDELALAAGVAPDAFRRLHLAHDPRALAVLDAVLELAGGLDGPRGMGIARYKNRQGCAAVVAQVAVDEERAEIRVEHLWIAADVGRVIDPDGLRNQLEGGAVQAVSWCLKEAVEFDERGAVVNRDWESYPILRFSEVPQVRTVLLDRPESEPLGAGEATVGPASGALANAVFAATGLRVRDLPMTPDRLRRVAAGL